MFIQETQDPSAVLWLDEIQDAILKANQDTKEALQCKNTYIYATLVFSSLKRAKTWHLYLQSLRPSRLLTRRWTAEMQLRRWLLCVVPEQDCMASRLSVRRPIRTTWPRSNRRKRKKVRSLRRISDVAF